MTQTLLLTANRDLSNLMLTAMTKPTVTVYGVLPLNYGLIVDDLVKLVNFVNISSMMASFVSSYSNELFVFVE